MQKLSSERSRAPAQVVAITAANVAIALLFAGAIALFSGLLEEILDNDWLVRRDVTINNWFHAHVTGAGLKTFYVITQIGQPGVWITVAGVAVWLYRGNRRLRMVQWLAVTLGGALVAVSIKLLVHRTRPEYAAAYLQGSSYSFPSGHAMDSTICFGFLALLLAARGSTSRKLLCYGAATFIVLLVGFSRIYLGVHYVSDVVGGIAAGVAWLIACLTVSALLKRHYLDHT